MRLTSRAGRSRVSGAVQADCTSVRASSWLVQVAGMPSSGWTSLQMGASPGQLQICALQLGTSNSCTGMQPFSDLQLTAIVLLSPCVLQAMGMDNV